MVRKNNVSRANRTPQSLTQSGLGGKKGASRAKFTLSQNNMKQSLSQGNKLDPEEGLFFINEIASLITGLQEQVTALERVVPGVRSYGAAAKRGCRYVADTVRGLSMIAEAISPNRPPCTKTVLKMIRSGLPARKVAGAGWIASRKRVRGWIKEQQCRILKKGTRKECCSTGRG